MIRLNRGLAWRDFDGEIVVYHEDTGNSFLLSGMAARIFAAIRQAPVGRAELAGRICTGAAVDAPGDAVEVFAASLRFLQELEAVSV